MTDVKDFFIASNIVHNAPDYDSHVLSTLVQTVEAFARVTYQSVYLIDYYNQDFLYVSENSLFLCGHTAKEVKELGYSFYLEHVPDEEQKMLVELNGGGFKFFDTFDNVDKYQCPMSYHFHLKSGTRSKLINHQLTPILLIDEDKIYYDGNCKESYCKMLGKDKDVVILSYIFYLIVFLITCNFLNCRMLTFLESPFYGESNIWKCGGIIISSLK